MLCVRRSMNISYVHTSYHQRRPWASQRWMTSSRDDKVWEIPSWQIPSWQIPSWQIPSQDHYRQVMSAVVPSPNPNEHPTHCSITVGHYLSLTQQYSPSLHFALNTIIQNNCKKPSQSHVGRRRRKWQCKNEKTRRTVERMTTYIQ